MSLFQGQDQSPQPEPVKVPEDKKVLDELVGEGKKFKTPEDLARGKIESDNFISRLQDENKELRDEVKARKNLEELAAELATAQRPAITPASASNESEPSVRERDVITPVDISKTVEEVVAKREAAASARSNLQKVKEKLQDSFGNNFPQVLKQKARAIDPSLTEQDLDNLAARNPNALFAMLGLNQSTQRQVLDTTTAEETVNTSAFQPNVGQERTMKYYQDMKRTDKVKYFSKEVANQMYIDAKRLGEKFFDT